MLTIGRRAVLRAKSLVLLCRVLSEANPTVFVAEDGSGVVGFLGRKLRAGLTSLAVLLGVALMAGSGKLLRKVPAAS